MSDDYDFDTDTPLTLQDYCEIIADTIDEAMDLCETREQVEYLCQETEKKLRTVLAEMRKRMPDATEPERDDPTRWWDQ